MKSQRRREHLLQAYDVLRSELNWGIKENSLLSDERDRLLTERNALQTDRDRLALEAHDRASERDRLLAERNALQTERDAIMSERDDEYRESKARREEREGHYTDMDTLFGIVLNAGGGDSGKAQLNQDVLALVVNRFKTGGFFVEFGATNGRDLSNTYILEKNYGWTGILAEPATVWHEDLAKNRQCIIDTDCVWSKTGETLDFDMVQEGEFSTISSFSDSDSHAALRHAKTTFKVKTISLFDLLTKHAAPNRIDYMSVDTEGSEYEILKDFDFDSYSFNFISVEHNFTENRNKLKKLLEANGYRRICEHISRWDDWYVPS